MFDLNSNHKSRGEKMSYKYHKLSNTYLKYLFEK